MGDKTKAILFVLLAVAVASVQDALVKALQGGYPTWEVVAFRGAVALILFSAWARMTHVRLFVLGRQWPLVVARSSALFCAYMAFALATATISLADAAALYFTMPFFVAMISARALGERVPPLRWMVIIVGFIGVMICIQPGSDSFKPASLLGLGTAVGYAIGQTLARRMKSAVPALAIANMQSLFYFTGAVLIGLVMSTIHTTPSPTFAALARPFMWPGWVDLGLMLVVGITSFISSWFFVRAYHMAAASFVAPFEYSAMIWSILFGILGFGDWPNATTLIGAAIVIFAGLFMLAMDRRSQGAALPQSTG